VSAEMIGGRIGRALARRRPPSVALLLAYAGLFLAGIAFVLVWAFDTSPWAETWAPHIATAFGALVLGALVNDALRRPQQRRHQHEQQQLTALGTDFVRLSLINVFHAISADFVLRGGVRLPRPQQPVPADAVLSRWLVALREHPPDNWQFAEAWRARLNAVGTELTSAIEGQPYQLDAPLTASIIELKAGSQALRPGAPQLERPSLFRSIRGKKPPVSIGCSTAAL
jgi:hypothetical protein